MTQGPRTKHIGLTGHGSRPRHADISIVEPTNNASLIPRGPIPQPLGQVWGWVGPRIRVDDDNNVLVNTDIDEVPAKRVKPNTLHLGE